MYRAAKYFQKISHHMIVVFLTNFESTNQKSLNSKKFRKWQKYYDLTHGFDEFFLKILILHFLVYFDSLCMNQFHVTSKMLSTSRCIRTVITLNFFTIFFVSIIVNCTTDIIFITMFSFDMSPQF